MLKQIIKIIWIPFATLSVLVSVAGLALGLIIGWWSMFAYGLGAFVILLIMSIMLRFNE